MQILFVVKAIDYIDSIGLMFISSIARKRGHTTHLGILSRENIIHKIEKIRPQVVAYSATTGEHKYYFEINKAIKSRFRDIFTIMGGAHTTFYPECIEGSSLDAICIGEGEEAFAEVLEAVEKDEDVKGIKNILTSSCYSSSDPAPLPSRLCSKNKGAGESRRTACLERLNFAQDIKEGKHIGSNNLSCEVRPLNQDLDSLPTPDRELFYAHTEMGTFPLKSFVTSRGCPYTCTYCFNRAFAELYKDKGRVVRRHSVDYVINEIKEVKSRYALGFVKFYDDIFAYRVDAWLEEFVKRYKSEIGLPFHCLTRADLLNKDIARLLKEAGCHSLSMSIEAGNPRIRNEMLKRRMGEEDIIRAFAICRRYNIKTFSNNIIGLPFATLENEMETIDLNLKCGVSFAEFPIFHPYPKTALGTFCLEKGIYDSHYEDLHMSYMNKSPLSCFTEKEKNIQKNLSRLGGLVILFPFLRNIVLRFLIHLPYNRFFFLCYYLGKAYLVHRKIYPFRLGINGLWRLFIKSLNLESFKLSDEQRKNASQTA